MATDYYEFLESEMLPAFGCTEPIALAYASAKCREVLGAEPESITAICSGNIIKNAKAVVVPNSGGEKGIEISVILGMLAGRSEKKLEVLSEVPPKVIAKAKKLRAEGLCRIVLAEGVAGLFIQIVMEDGSGNRASVRLEKNHTNITLIERNGEILHEAESRTEAEEHRDFSFDKIYDFAENCDLERLRPLLEREISFNMRAAEEGLRGSWGAEIGRFVYDNAKGNKDYAIAYAAAAADARMSGCELPVVTNSGSGNQGLTVSLPIIKYAELEGIPEEKMLRALVFSNLLGEYQKQGIGRLSAFCSVVSAGAAAVAGIAYMENQPKPIIEQTIINALAVNSGMICDGAKPSCAGKIVAAINMAFMGYNQAKQDRSYHPGDGIVRDNIDETIQSVGRIARFGMQSTDVTILNEMIRKNEEC